MGRKILRKLARFQPRAFFGSISRSLVCLVFWLLPAPRRGNRHFFFLYNNRNHKRLLQGAASRLAERGHSVTILESKQVARMMRLARRGDVVVVCCDWSPNEVGMSMGLLKWSGVTRFGLQEGIRYGKPRKYIWIDHFLAWGPAAAAASKTPTSVVGSPTVEALPARSGHNDSPSFALINYRWNLDPEKRGPWMAKIGEACAEIGLTPIFSGHPVSTAAFAHKLSKEEFRDLLPRATIVITPDIVPWFPSPGP